MDVMDISGIEPDTSRKERYDELSNHMLSERDRPTTPYAHLRRILLLQSPGQLSGVVACDEEVEMA